MNRNSLTRIVAHAALLVTLFAMLPSRSLAQSDSTDTTFTCGTAWPSLPPRQLGGTYLPTGNGINNTPTPAVIHALVLFIEFSDDDNTQGAPWPRGTTPTAMMTDIIDPSPSTQSGKKYNITTYFRDMSFGKFVVAGQTVRRSTRYSLAQYRGPITSQDATNAGHPEDTDEDYSDNVRYWAFRHVMEDLDPSMDFTPFDTWTISGAYDYSVGADGVIDLIIVCWRNDASYVVTNTSGGNSRVRDQSFQLDGNNYEGIADLGSDAPFTLDLGDRTVKTHAFSGSGVTVLNMLRYPWMGVVYHEIGHMLGLTHQYSGGVWTLMGSRNPNVSYCMNSFERERMGWMSATDVTTDGQTATLDDFATEGTAYRIGVNSNSSFFVENHQRKTSDYITSLPTNRPWYDPNDFLSYDVVDYASDGAPGLYILQEKYGALSVVAADGRWSWEVMDCPHSTVIAPWSQTQKLLVWQRNAIDRIGGKTDREHEASHTIECDQTSESFGNDFIWAWRDQQRRVTVNTGVGKQRGDTKDRWRTGEIFSPWSNPSSRSADANTMAGLEVTGEGSGLVDVKFYLTDPEAGPPSKPQDLRIATAPGSQTTYYYPKLTWAVNIEDDVNPLGDYEIYRLVGSTWTYVTSVAGNVSTYIDTDAEFSRDFAQTFKYRLRVVDVESYVSAYSDEAWLTIVPIEHGNGTKRATGAITGSTGLTASHSPNPASTQTTIVYRIEENGPVTVDVFDIRGGKVATLVDEDLPEGTHTVVFDTSDLGRGIYTYVVRHNGDMFTGKIVLE